MDRRQFFLDLTRYAALAAATPNVWRLRWHPSFADDPFALGVACGDPTNHGAILWTRLAPKPLEPGGGMNGVRAVVQWEVAEDEHFSRIAKKGQATAVPELAHSVHVDVDGLKEDRWYYYRFRSGDAVSDIGRLRTTPDDSADTPFRFAFASCQNYEQGYYTALQHLANEEVDLAVHLGDYIYETAGAAVTATRARMHAGPNIHTLEDYRQRYGQYKSDPALRAAHARCPWLVIWDDHEVDNNYATLINESPTETVEMMKVRRTAAYQAWWENQPVRITPPKNWMDLEIYRSVNWGKLARFWAIDDRQYRSDQPCADGDKPIPCGDWGDSAHTMLGPEQEKWLLNGFAKSKSQWQVLANQVVFAPPDEQPKEGGDRVSMDKWAGYPVARDRVLAAIGDHAPNRTVVLTGDIHDNWVYDVRRGFDKPDRPVIAVEFVGTSLTSGGDGTDNTRIVTPEYLAAHPSLKWAQNRRGYVVCAVNSKEWRADYRTVQYVSRPDAPIYTASAWLVEHGRPGVQRI